MDIILEKHSITSEQGKALLLRKLLYEGGVRFMVQDGVMGAVYLCLDRPQVPPGSEIEELRDLDDVYLAEKDGELFVVKRKTL